MEKGGGRRVGGSDAAGAGSGVDLEFALDE